MLKSSNAASALSNTPQGRLCLVHMLQSQRIWLSSASKAQSSLKLASAAAFRVTFGWAHATARHSTYAACNRRDIAARTQRQTVEFITSTSNSLVKHCVKLRTNARYRAEHRQFLVTGLDLLQEAAGGDSGCIHAQVLFLPKQADVTSNCTSLPGAPWLTADRLIVTDENVLKKLTGLSNVDSVTAVAQLELPPPVNLHEWQGAHYTHVYQNASQQEAVQQVEEGTSMPGAQQPRGSRQHDTTTLQTQMDALTTTGQDQTNIGQHARKLVRLLALDCVQDPGNMGTLIRSALAFGWDAIYLLPGCCDPYNEKSVRASRGAVLRMPIAAGNLEELVQSCSQRGMLLIAAEPSPDNQTGHTQHDNRHTQDVGVCLVLGSEGRGLSPAVLQACRPVAIPMAGEMESLNVGVAGSILMFMLSPAGHTTLTARLSALGLNSLSTTNTVQASD